MHGVKNKRIFPVDDCQLMRCFLFLCFSASPEATYLFFLSSLLYFSCQASRSATFFWKTYRKQQDTSLLPNRLDSACSSLLEGILLL